MKRSRFALLSVLGCLAGCGSSSAPADGPGDSDGGSTDHTADNPAEDPGDGAGDSPFDGGPTDHAVDSPAADPGDGPADRICPPVETVGCPFGYIPDESGCFNRCKDRPPCPTLNCSLNCENGLRKDLAGCDICTCQPPYSRGCGSECFDALYASCTPAGSCKHDNPAGLTCYSNGVRITSSNNVTVSTTDGTTTCFTLTKDVYEPPTGGAVTRVIYRNAAGGEIARREVIGTQDPILTCGTTQVTIDRMLCPGLQLQESDGLPPLQTRRLCSNGTCP